MQNETCPTGHTSNSVSLQYIPLDTEGKKYRVIVSYRCSLCDKEVTKEYEDILP